MGLTGGSAGCKSGAWLAEITLVAGIAGGLAVPEDGWCAGCLRPGDSGLLAISVLCVSAAVRVVNGKCNKIK
jgi:hypothetical protein